VIVLRNRLGVIRWRLIFSSCLKTLAASGLMALGVVMTCRFLIPPETETGSLRLLAGIGAGIIGGIAIFSAAAWKMKIPEWQQVMALMRRSLNRS
jgi:putative peptidoglycan lipid II flippase